MNWSFIVFCQNNQLIVHCFQTQLKSIDCRILVAALCLLSCGALRRILLFVPPTVFFTKHFIFVIQFQNQFPLPKSVFYWSRYVASWRKVGGVGERLQKTTPSRLWPNDEVPSILYNYAQQPLLNLRSNYFILPNGLIVLPTRTLPKATKGSETTIWYDKMLTCNGSRGS